jgi:uncharacterized repeat protein (TIGR03803 family)
MKRCIKNRFVLPVLVATLASVLLGQSAGQTFKTLYSFTAVSQPDGINSDGANPTGRLIGSGTNLYGVTYDGGAFGNGSLGYGTVFAINTDGTGFTNLHQFSGGPDDGVQPPAGLILSGTTLYGTTALGGSQGGTVGGGTVFSLNTDGTGFQIVHSLDTFTEGFSPDAGLILSDNTLYGTTGQLGGLGGWGNGTVFAVNTDGTDFTTLYIFTSTNGNGYAPAASLILSGNTLYGTAHAGGDSGNGTVFAINTNDGNFTILHSFSASNSNSSGDDTNSDGIAPLGLILSGDKLYGTTTFGGTFGTGTLFAVNTNGTGYTNLHNFSGWSTNSLGTYTNSDGAHPNNLIFLGTALYGTAGRGGNLGAGIAFALNTDGTGFTTLHSFSYTNDGSLPYAGLILSNTMYGTAFEGGSWDSGTVFSISLVSVSRPTLTISPSAGNVVLSWPTGSTVFTLQSTTKLGSDAIWTTVSPGPVVVNGQNTVTTPITGRQQFYRLSL